LSKDSTPFALGFRMPAEWEPHEATWIGWPHELTDWPGKFTPIQWVYAEIVRHLARVERVRVFIEDAAAELKARAVLKKSGANLEAVEFFRIPTNRGWTRDFGPLFVRHTAGRVAMTHWGFNAWAKYDDFQKDATAVPRVNRKLRFPIWQPEHRGRRVVLEGGSIDVNGKGTLLTTEECLLSPIQARNPGFSRAEMEEIFRDFLGATHTLWLRNGIAGDDTHGHVDDLARFVDPTTIVAVVERDPSEENFAPLQENLALLKDMKDEDGRALQIATLPMPEPVYFARQRLPASYANFYIANKMVLVPTFNDPNDREALDTLAGLFPNRQIIGIASRDLVLGLGTLHCLTQQQPTGEPFAE